LKVGPHDREDFDVLMANAHEARARALTHFLHLDQPSGIWHYIRIANEIAAQVPPGKLLDWGCGFGQMTYLLRRRGFDVTPFEVGPEDKTLPDIPLCRDLNVVCTPHPTRLPFLSESFDVVLSCGVLEHVDEGSEPGNEMLSLREITRVLRPRGYFPIYQLPQRYSWTEALQRRLRLGYWHPRRFTAKEIRRLLSSNGYRIERLRRYSLLPKNLTGMPEPMRAFYGRFGHALISADEALSRIPGLNQLAGVMEILARRAA
jgi:SAM-dependent methyltransferase